MVAGRDDSLDKAEGLTARIIDMIIDPLCSLLSYIANRTRNAIDVCLALFQEGGGLFSHGVEEGELLLGIVRWGGCHTAACTCQEGRRYRCCGGVPHCCVMIRL